MLYKRYAPKMYGVCLRFAKNKMEADDILQDGFIKILTNIKSYRNEGSLEGWVRKTIVNTAINFYKKNARYLKDISIEQTEIINYDNEGIIDNLSVKELLNLVQQLPEGYRLIFNLYVIEGYTHKEISKMLKISENTSKSQLSRARKTLQKEVLKQQKSY
ncbi:MAG: sigma-70 family RNA polymerase sigma factor [Bacteroidales bacterium]|nr:sigma-70 family RNA polymerase sigma factor [Bacteroidales bacterium]